MNPRNQNIAALVLALLLAAIGAVPGEGASLHDSVSSTMSGWIGGAFPYMSLFLLLFVFRRKRSLDRHALSSILDSFAIPHSMLARFAGALGGAIVLGVIAALALAGEPVERSTVLRLVAGGVVEAIVVRVLVNLASPRFQDRPSLLGSWLNLGLALAIFRVLLFCFPVVFPASWETPAWIMLSRFGWAPLGLILGCQDILRTRDSLGVSRGSRL